MPLGIRAQGWLRYKWSWAKEGHLVWLNLVLMIAVLGVVFCWRTPDPDDPLRLRTLGGALQLLGVATVWFDLAATARRFDTPGHVRGTLAWLARFRRKPIRLVAADLRSTTTADASFLSSIAVNPEMPLAQRVARLEGIAEEFTATLARIEREAKEQARTIESRITAEAAARSSDVAKVLESLKQATTGNHAWLAFGAWWLGVGVILATWPAEIAKAVEGRWDLIVKVL